MEKDAYDDSEIASGYTFTQTTTRFRTTDRRPTAGYVRSVFQLERERERRKTVDKNAAPCRQGLVACPTLYEYATNCHTSLCFDKQIKVVMEIIR
jgi:hypothetical protein